jgi:hypothetical protein
MKILAWGCVAIGLLSGLGWLLAPFLIGRHSCSNERNAWATLKTFVSAQEDYRDHDRDGDGKKEFWRKDVAGLYSLIPAGSTEMIKLIELSDAGADLASTGTAEIGAQGPAQVHIEQFTVHSPKAGHWFIALRFEDEVDRLDPQRFAFCAVADSMSAGRSVYIISQDGVVWEAPARLARDVPRAYPDNPEKSGWRRKDR